MFFFWKHADRILGDQFYWLLVSQFPFQTIIKEKVVGLKKLNEIKQNKPFFFLKT